MHKMLALLVRLVYNMYVSKKEKKEYPMRSRRFEVQYKVGFSWFTTTTHGTESGALRSGEVTERSNPDRKHRIVMVENGRKSTIHIF